MGLDKAGQSVRAGPNGQWIATLPKAQQERYLAARPGLEDDWDDQWGDRGSQLVFIGREYDEDALVERLEDCLLTDTEMNANWEGYPDPFSADDQQELALADD